MKKILILGITGILGFFGYWLFLPPLNVQSIGMWFFLLVLFVFAGLFDYVLEDFDIMNWFSIGCFSSAIVIMLVLIIGGLSGSQLFHAKTYQQLLQVEERVFQEDISQIAMEQVPILDRESAERLGDRRMGVMLEYVSQFEVSNEYTQINLENRPVRVTPLIFGGFIKWWNNRSNGIPGYIKVDMVTQGAELVKLKQEGMQYVPSAYFSYDLNRHIRFNYPTYLFGEKSFEVDDEGNPYYVVTVLENKIGLFGGEDVKGALLVDPISGESTYYPIEEVPSWVDRVCPEYLISRQINWYGEYKDGLLNSISAQKGVLNCTRGYNYLAMEDDIWLYTGMTSKGQDESNVGFVLVNMRTKKARYYSCPGAEEFSAMASAEGAVKNYGYTATFPLLINVNGEPTYLCSLKDSALLVKMYAFVNVTDYQIVCTGTTLDEAFAKYVKTMGRGYTDTLELQGRIHKVRSAVKEGTTYYYLQMDGEDSIYIVSIDTNAYLPFVETNDLVTLHYIESDDEAKEVIDFKLKQEFER